MGKQKKRREVAMMKMAYHAAILNLIAALIELLTKLIEK